MQEAHKMEYNSSREKLMISEYGRNIQNLLNHAVTIEDDEERQTYANRIVALMLQMNPQSRNLAEYKDKLWRHAFIITDHKLNVKTPSGVTPEPEETKLRPEQIEYPKNKTKFRHYGQNVLEMINKAVLMEDPEMQKSYTIIIGSYMKLAYQTWNREHYVNDEIIKKDLVELSNGKLDLGPDISLDHLRGVSIASNTSHKHRRKPYKSKGKNNNNNNNRNRRRR